ncbi:AAA family ATPase [Isosphaeraceae bacterium EP7]
MRIDRLDLQAFGPFQGRTLDLSAGQHGLHLIHGPNEAGKSSAMRAVRALFFGIPVQTPDNFLHSYDKLSLEADLRLADGTSLTVRRRKGKKDTLSRIGPDGTQVPDDDALRAHFSGVDEAQFNQRYGLGHDELTQGGRALVEGRGDLGEALFTAGIGLAELKNLMSTLTAQAEALFLPRGKSVPLINKALADLKEKRKELQGTEIAGEAWARQEMQVKDSRQRGSEMLAQLRARRAERGKLEALTQARPLLLRRQAALEGLERLRYARLLRPEFAAERSQAERDRAAALTRHEDARKTQVDLAGQIDAMEPPGPLLDASDAIEHLREQLGTHRKDLVRRPQIADRLAAAEDEARARLAELRPDLALDEVGSLRPTKAQVAAIRSLGQRREALADRLDAARKAIAHALDAQARLAGDGGSAEGPGRVELESLQQAIDAARQAGDLDTRRARAQADLNASSAKARRDLDRLAGWNGSLDELEALCVPDSETLGSHETRLRDAEDDLKRLGDELGEAEADRNRATVELDRCREQGDVPTEADLLRARARRDAGWRLVLDVWKGPETDAVTQAAVGVGFDFLADLPPGADLASAFAGAQAEADTVADRLRREAQRSAELAHARSRLELAAHRVGMLRARVRRARRHLDAARSDWASRLWARLGLDPLPPRETRAWLQSHQSLCTQAEAVRTGGATLAELDREIGHHRGALAAALGRLGHAAGATDGFTLADPLTRAQALANHLRETDQARAELAGARREADEAEASLARWKLDWEALVRPIGLDADATSEDASAMLGAIDDLLRKVEDRDKCRRELATIDGDADRFESQSRVHIAQLAPDLVGQPVHLAVQTLAARLKLAGEAKVTRDGLVAQGNAAELKARAAELKIAEATAQLEALCREAGVDHVDDLPLAEEASRERRDLEQRRREIDDQLTDLGGGMDVDSIRDQIDAYGLGPKEMEEEIQRLDDDIKVLEEAYGEERQVTGQMSQELDRMDGAPTAARLNQDVQCILAGIDTDADRYIRARLASAVLRTAIDRYRQKNQDPILNRASDLFAALTLGSFKALKVDNDDRDDRPVLRGVRPDDRTVDVAGMSDGTADQLYLSLRLASLEGQLNPREPLPLLVDDILIQFDDARAVAALRALAELATRTQVLMFTHHGHLLPLAQAKLPKGTVFVHELA